MTYDLIMAILFATAGTYTANVLWRDKHRVLAIWLAAHVLYIFMLRTNGIL